MCVKRDFQDGYGEHLSRSYACKDENKSVVVKITDRCVDGPTVIGLWRVLTCCKHT